MEPWQIDSMLQALHNIASGIGFFCFMFVIRFIIGIGVK